jgi:hypothetical protein
MGMGRDFPIMERAYEDPKAHWSLDWIVVGSILGTAFVLAVILLAWWLR